MFSEWFWKIVSGVYLTHLHNIVSNMLRHYFLVRGATSIIRVRHHTRFVQQYRCRFEYLDLHWSKVGPDHNILLTALFGAVNLAENLSFCTAVCIFYYHVLGVDPITENNPMINIPVTLLWTFLESTNILMYNSSRRGSVNCSSISSLKYLYWFSKSCFIWTFS